MLEKAQYGRVLPTLSLQETFKDVTGSTIGMKVVLKWGSVKFQKIMEGVRTIGLACLIMPVLSSLSLQLF